MNSRAKKLEAQHEKIIRGLLRLPENRSCFSCTTKTTPQYVCTTFATFICTTCSGVHRGFGYRVKSISYASFTPEEVEALKLWGNEKGRQKWLAEWTKEQIQVPEEGNEKAISRFIDSVFERKRFVKRESVQPNEPPPVKEMPADMRAPQMVSPPAPVPAPVPVPAPTSVASTSSWVAFGEDAQTTPVAPAAPASSDPFAMPNSSEGKLGGTSQNAPEHASQPSSGWATFGSEPVAAPVPVPVAAPPAATTTQSDPFAMSGPGAAALAPEPAQPVQSNDWVAFDSPAPKEVSQQPPATGGAGTAEAQVPPPAEPEEPEPPAKEEPRKALPLDLFSGDLSPSPQPPAGGQQAFGYAQGGPTPPQPVPQNYTGHPMMAQQGQMGVSGSPGNAMPGMHFQQFSTSPNMGMPARPGNVVMPGMQYQQPNMGMPAGRGNVVMPQMQQQPNMAMPAGRGNVVMPGMQYQQQQPNMGMPAGRGNVVMPGMQYQQQPPQPNMGPGVAQANAMQFQQFGAGSMSQAPSPAANVNPSSNFSSGNPFA